MHSSALNKCSNEDLSIRIPDARAKGYRDRRFSPEYAASGLAVLPMPFRPVRIV